MHNTKRRPRLNFVRVTKRNLMHQRNTKNTKNRDVMSVTYTNKCFDRGSILGFSPLHLIFLLRVHLYSREKEPVFHLTSVKIEWFTSSEWRFRTKTQEKKIQKKFCVKLCFLEKWELCSFVKCGGNVFLSHVLTKDIHPGNLLESSHFTPKACWTHSPIWHN